LSVSRPAAALLAGLALAVMVSACGRPTTTEASIDPARILRKGNGPEPESLDIHRARSEPALTILRDLYEGLTEIGPSGAAVLAAADRYSTSADGRTYRFHLRDNAHWSNGDPVSAADFVAAWRRLVDPHTAAQYSQLLAPIRGAQSIALGKADPSTLGVQALDDADLEVQLEHPTPYFLALLSHPAAFPIHRASLAAHGGGFAKPGVMVSNGAFVLTRWDFGSHLRAARNHHYWNDAATQLDAVEYYSMAEPATEFAAFRSGQLDSTMTVPSEQFAFAKQQLAKELHLAPQLAVYYLGLNLRKAPLADSPALRRALSMVIDRQRLVDAVTGMGEAPAFSFVPPQTLNYSPAQPGYAAWPMPQRIAAARELLRAAGLSNAALHLELRYNSGELHNRLAVAVAAMWKQSLGIETDLHAEEFKVLLQDLERGDVVQISRGSWLADYDDAYSFLQVLQSGFGINTPHYSNPQYDALLAAAAAEPDPQQRRALLEQAEAIMLADQPLIPLYFYVAKHLVNQHVRGWQDNPMNVVYAKALSKPVP
jgi:oligopeptide transport system substrate-binding protein